MYICNTDSSTLLDYFQGAVYVYKAVNQYLWHPIQIITPPAVNLDSVTAKTVLNTQLNFGIAVDIEEDTDTIIVGANAYCKS